MPLSDYTTADLVAEVASRRCENYDALLGHAKRLCEQYAIDYDVICLGRGKMPVPTVRDAVCAAMADLGYSHSSIAIALHRAHPSSIAKAIKRHRERNSHNQHAKT